MFQENIFNQLHSFIRVILSISQSLCLGGPCLHFNALSLFFTIPVCNLPPALIQFTVPWGVPTLSLYYRWDPPPPPGAPVKTLRSQSGWGFCGPAHWLSHSLWEQLIVLASNTFASLEWLSFSLSLNDPPVPIARTLPGSLSYTNRTNNAAKEHLSNSHSVQVGCWPAARGQEDGLLRDGVLLWG